MWGILKTSMWNLKLKKKRKKEKNEKTLTLK